MSDDEPWFLNWWLCSCGSERRLFFISDTLNDNITIINFSLKKCQLRKHSLMAHILYIS